VLASTLAVINLPVFWFMTTSVDNGESIVVGITLPCPFQAATKFNLTGLNEFAVEVGLILNLTAIILFVVLLTPELLDQVNIALMIELLLPALNEYPAV
jgi:hypothetical protein